MGLLTRNTGIWVSVIGIAMFLLNFVTYSLWEIDIDVLGVLIFVLGVTIMIACGKSMKHSSELLSRRNGVWMCILSVALILIPSVIILLVGYLPFISGDVAGIISLGLFVLGLIVIAVRWNH